ncbi:disulfide bond formation protein DsbA [Halobacteriovorax marinus]|uniref:Disulfide bond formation protein DsbA n=1 Tax=Halobacteriovorax marinus TaxID=97084 RepID=A0A1Y5F970_9BACT|nr:disulfide bond formation protein DsbA [Halobacteriovorax marinus]
MKNKKVIVGVSVFVMMVVFALAASIYKNQMDKKMSFLASDNVETFIRDYSPTLGSDDAEIHLVEFLDPECESCRMFYPYVKKLMSEYPGKIKLVVRYMPFHTNSKFVIKILEASRKQGKYWEALETLFKYQPKWGSHHNPRPELVWTFLPEVGVDVEQIKRDMNDPSFVKIIEQDLADGRTLGVRATPSFFVNGKPLKKFGYSYLKDLIEAELK